jgi:hypothetical protein
LFESGQLKKTESRPELNDDMWRMDALTISKPLSARERAKKDHHARPERGSNDRRAENREDLVQGLAPVEKPATTKATARPSTIFSELDIFLFIT